MEDIDFSAMFVNKILGALLLVLKTILDHQLEWADVRRLFCNAYWFSALNEFACLYVIQKNISSTHTMLYTWHL